MMKTNRKNLVLAMGTTLLTGLTSVAVQAETVGIQGGVFEMTELSSGYMQLVAAETTTDATKDTSKDKASNKAPEAKCAGAKPMTEPKAKEGKCGEGKCGGEMKHSASDASKSAADTNKTATDAKKTTTDVAKSTGEAAKATDSSAVKK